ncbi:hypothetical protein RB594_007571 [Gaeumannomyces avenae]
MPTLAWLEATQMGRRVQHHSRFLNLHAPQKWGHSSVRARRTTRCLPARDGPKPSSSRRVASTSRSVEVGPADRPRSGPRVCRLPGSSQARPSGSRAVPSRPSCCPVCPVALSALSPCLPGSGAVFALPSLSLARITALQIPILPTPSPSMSERAPGQDGPKDEPECFNCGVRGHFVIACPEEVRKVPAGLQAFRQRKAASQSKNSSQGGSGQGKGAGGMVITRYGPPPGHHSQLANYLPHASLPLPPPPPAQAQAAPYYPPPPAPAPAPPAPAAGWPYPPSSYGAGYPAPPPPPPRSYPPYDPYSQPSVYGPPGHLPPPGHPPGPPPVNSYHPPYGTPPQPYYPPPQQTYTPPAPYPAHGPPPVPAAHPPHPSLPPVPPPPYPYPPPTQSYPGPYEAHQPYYPPAYPSEIPRGHPQNDRSRNQRHRNGPPHHKGRDRDRDRDRDKGRDRDREKDRGRGSKHQRKGQGQRNRSPSKAAEMTTTRPSTLPKVPPPSLPARQPRRTPDTVEPVPDKDHVGKPKKEPTPEIEDDDFEWELQAAFAQHPTKPADAVGRPLPNEYSDAPTIPPAFDSNSIRSDFFSADNCAEFLRSIRELKFWEKAKNDPAFLAWPGMVRCRFPNSPHEYPSYASTAPTGDRSETVVKDEVLLDEIVVKQRYSPRQARELSASRSGDMKPHGSLGKHSRAANGSDWHSQAKRFKGSEASTPRSAYDSPSSGSRRYRGDAGDGGPSEQPQHRSSHQPDARVHTNGRQDPRQPNDSSSSGRGRHDSGYQSNNSPEKMHGRSRSRPRPDARYRSRSRSPPRGYARYGSRRGSESPRGQHDRGPSPSSPPRSGSSSPLDDLEMEILGMVREVVSEKKGPRADAKPKRRQIKVADAFSRRW